MGSQPTKTKLPNRPDTSRADAEIASLAAGDVAVRLSPEAQIELAMLYQYSRQLGEALGDGGLSAVEVRRVRREMRDAQEGLNWLIRALEGLVFKVVAVESRRLGGRARSEIDDLRGDAAVAEIEAIGSFDPSRGTTLAGWVADMIRRRCSDRGATGLPRDWHRVSRLAGGILPELSEELGREPTRDELRDAILERCRARTLERLTPEERRLPRDERNALVHSRLRKSSMLRAIEELDSVLQASAATFSLDAPVGDGGAAFGDLLVDGTDCSVEEIVVDAVDGRPGGLADVLWGGLDEKEVAMVLARTGLEAGDPQTLENVAEQFGVARGDVRRAVRATMARAVAPHAQFAHLDPGLPSAFSTDGSESTAALLARRGNIATSKSSV